MTKAEIYKALSDIIADSYDWLSNKENRDIAVQYILGLNDMARHLAEKIEEKE